MKRFCLLLTTMFIAFTSVMALETTTFTTEEGAVLKISLSSVGNTATVTGIENTSFKGVLNIPLEVEYGGTMYSIVTIGEEAFMNCKMNAANLGNVSTVGASAFRGCSNIPSLDLSNVKYIGDYAFYMKGSTLTSIIFSGKLLSVGTQAFPQGLGCSVTDVTVNVNDITEIIGLPIPFFYYTTEVKYYVAGELLKEIVIPEGITTLSGFNYIRGISFISLPSTLQSIAENTFTEIQTSKIYCYAKTPPTISDKAHPFIHLDEIELFVPHGRKKAYMMDNWWKSFPNIIEMEGEGEIENPGDSITVKNAGDLSNALAAIDKEHITNLVIKGRLSAADIKVIRAAEGKLATLDSLDLSDVTLVPSDECYYSYTMMMDGSMSSEYYRFFIGTERKDTTWTEETLSMWPPHYHDHYDNNLTAAFTETNLKRLVLPHSISDIGERTFRGCGNLQEVIMTNAATSIGKEAFRDCRTLAMIPDMSKVEEIGERAFYNCAQLGLFDEKKHLDLTSVTNVSDEAFYGCKQIQSVMFSDKLVAIGNFAFANCTKLNSVNTPPNLSRLSYYSFDNTPWLTANKEMVDGITYLGTVAIGCDNVQTLLFRDGTLGIADYFKKQGKPKSVILPSTLRYIGKRAFNALSITSIDIPASVEAIGDEAFWACQQLEKIDLPDQLKHIGQQAFRACPFEEIVIPDEVESVGYRAFYECTNLKRVYYGAQRSTEQYIFNLCEGIREITIGNKVTRIPSRTFEPDTIEVLTLGERLEKLDDYAITGKTEKLVLPASLRSIGKEALPIARELIFSEGIEEIGPNAFVNSEVEVLYLPEGLLKIGGERMGGAFSNCRKLHKVILPSTLQEIEPYAFHWCAKIDTIISNIKVPFEISRDVFSNSSALSNTLIVPTGTKELYQATNCWKEFKNIVEDTETNGVNSINSVSAIIANYDISGRKTIRHRGLNIVHYNDGKVKKVIIK